MSGIYGARILYDFLSFICFLTARYHDTGGVRDMTYLSLSFSPLLALKQTLGHDENLQC